MSDTCVYPTTIPMWKGSIGVAVTRKVNPTLKGSTWVPFGKAKADMYRFFKMNTTLVNPRAAWLQIGSDPFDSVFKTMPESVNWSSFTVQRSSHFCSPSSKPPGDQPELLSSMWLDLCLPTIGIYWLSLKIQKKKTSWKEHIYESFLRPHCTCRGYFF